MSTYDLTATFSDGTRIERGSGTPYEFAARSDRGKITWHRSENSARRAAGQRGAITSVDCSTERYDGWLKTKGMPPLSSPARVDPWPMYKHGCEHNHHTYAALARCRWPNCMQVSGEGQWGVKIESAYHQYASGRAAYWPNIYLFETEGQARDFYDHGHPDARSVQIFQMPDDPSAAEYDGLPFTQEGNRLRYAA